MRSPSGTGNADDSPQPSPAARQRQLGAVASTATTSPSAVYAQGAPSGLPEIAAAQALRRVRVRRFGLFDGNPAPARRGPGQPARFSLLPFPLLSGGALRQKTDEPMGRLRGPPRRSLLGRPAPSYRQRRNDHRPRRRWAGHPRNPRCPRDQATLVQPPLGRHRLPRCPPVGREPDRV